MNKVERIGIETGFYKYILDFGFLIHLNFYIIIEQVQLQKVIPKIENKVK